MLTEYESKRQRQLVRLIRNPQDVIENPDDVFKLWPRRRDREAWRAVMADRLPDLDHPYVEARAFFADRSRKVAAEAEGEPVEALDLLVDSCLDLFRVVVIDLDDNDDAQVIFEVLNGRQTPLSSVDLVKNLLFLRAEGEGVEDIEALYEQYWEPFDDPWWKTEVGRGHAARRHTDLMLARVAHCCYWSGRTSGSPVWAGPSLPRNRRGEDPRGAGHDQPLCRELPGRPGEGSGGG